MDMRLDNNMMRMMTKREAEGEADGEAGYGYQTYSETPFHKTFAGAYYTPDISPIHPVPAVPAVFNRGYRYRDIDPFILTRDYKIDLMLANVKYFLWLNILRQKTSTQRAYLQLLFNREDPLMFWTLGSKGQLPLSFKHAWVTTEGTFLSSLSHYL